jgi:hypothetical protein
MILTIIGACSDRSSAFLDQLLAEENKNEGKCTGSGIDSPRSSDFGHLPLVEFKRRKAVWSASHINLGKSKQANLRRDGILFRDRSIVMRHSKPSPLESRPGQFRRPPLLYHYYRRLEPIDDDAFRELMARGYALHASRRIRVESHHTL